MKGLVCKYCGGNQFEKIESGYECSYCHAVYELDAPPLEKRQPRKKLAFIISITLFLIVGILFISSILIPFSLKATPSKSGSKLTTFKPVTNAKSSTDSTTYSPSQLNNPERNVRIAELSLNQEEIDLALVSAEEYGGDKTEEFKERVSAAQKQHDTLEKNRLRTSPNEEMIIENPNSDFAITTYYREAGYLASYGPDFDQYSSSDILRIWGQPDKIVTDSEQIQKKLALKFDEQNNPINYEAKMLRKQWQQGELTWREVRAFIAINTDNTFGGFTKLFVYEKQGKPNVYLKNDQVGYVTPIVRYIYFNRLPEQYSRAGLGKYPDDFPENYGSDGLYHEK
ncbi:DUF4947 domain-containing protein [Enterococcus avium]|uniref:DUF4947 domain-containing protein n=1 Tax=Enterococcus avium TaxID=33945 RepID=UPI00159CF8D2|nr:DUF4947 domain-containing protein [Enterococcus avium]NVN58877.1 DUF4947 domain-containing protein [Enterococcus avium]NVN73039.1 DUF4947 domain-containing protein [Enterococcus avium]